jgi:ABC-type dipeptide/oligopeptide/nickel transport system permease subunit
VALRSWTARIAALVLLSVIALAIVGPWIAPHSPSALTGPPYSAPSSGSWLGTDYLGEDVLSRVLWGGRNVIVFAVVATALAYVVGGLIGLVAGTSRTLLDPALMRTVDVLLAFPAIFLILLLAARFGSSAAIVIGGIALVHIPFVARIVRTATLEVSVRPYVEVAVARGDSTLTIIRREIMPNLLGPISADLGPRLTISILLVAALNFLGVGVSPPSADWAVMVNENRGGLQLNHWAVTAPAALIALLTVSANVLVDAIAQAYGRTSETEPLV